MIANLLEWIDRTAKAMWCRYVVGHNFRGNGGPIKCVRCGLPWYK